LQPAFQKFWSTIIESKIPFVTFGIGINMMKGRPSVDNDILLSIAQYAKMIGVRDRYTEYRFKSLCNREIYMGICPSVNFLNKNKSSTLYSEAKTLLHIFHPADLRLAGLNVELVRSNLVKIAKYVGIVYVEHSNMSSDYEKVLGLYQNADLVVSSRLHGCIISYALGKSFLAMCCDEKIGYFLKSHTAIKGYNPKLLENYDALKRLITKTIRLPYVESDIKSKMDENRIFADKIIDLIS